jgi:hypothetical protein
MNGNSLISMVDAFTGQAQQPIVLFDRTGASGVSLSAAIFYNSATLATVTRWNQDAPTGPLGLGWQMARDRIIAVCGQSTAPGDVGYVLLFKGVPLELVCVEQSADTSTWATRSYQFWKITYRPADELWTVIDEQGTVYLDRYH